MAATLTQGAIKVNGRFQPVPFIYSRETQNTQPPFTITGNGDNRYVTYSRQTPVSSTIIKLNEGSDLWIVKNGAWSPMWQSVITNADGQDHVIYVFENGCSIRANLQSGATILRIKPFDANGQVIGTSQTSLNINATIYNACITCFTDMSDGALIPALLSIAPLTSSNNVITSGYLAGTKNVTMLTTIVPVIDPYGTDDNETPAGGYGDFDYTSEEVLPPTIPSLSAAQVGFVSLWNPTQAEMQALANYLWTGTFDLTNFKKLFTDPMECVLSVGIIPITPTRKQSGGSPVKEEIVFGGSSHSGVNAYPVTEQFYIVDMGTLHIDGKSNSYMDYNPYAKASIYLPYCGTYALDVDEIMDSDIELEYHIDVYTGACVAYLTINGHINSDGKQVHAIMYQFTGNVLASIPITGNDHSQFIQSMLFMGAAVAATVATSGAGAGAAGAGAGAGADLGAESTAAAATSKALTASAINTVMSMKQNVLHSGNLSSTAGLLGGQAPFVTMTWSNLCRPDDEYKLVGMPLHKSGTLSDFSGFTIVSACHMDNIYCTEQELVMIEQALGKGVII